MIFFDYYFEAPYVSKDLEPLSEYIKQYNYSEEYKKYTPNDDLASGGFRLIEILEQINKVKGIERIRLGSIEPNIRSIFLIVLSLSTTTKFRSQ